MGRYFSRAMIIYTLYYKRGHLPLNYNASRLQRILLDIRCLYWIGYYLYRIINACRRFEARCHQMMPSPRWMQISECEIFSKAAACSRAPTAPGLSSLLQYDNCLPFVHREVHLIYCSDLPRSTQRKSQNLFKKFQTNSTAPLASNFTIFN